MKNRRYMAVYVSDSFKKGRPFVPIGFELFSILQKFFDPIDIIAVVRHNRNSNAVTGIPRPSKAISSSAALIT